MAQSDEIYVPVGYIRDAHNLKGEVFVRLSAGQADWLDDLQTVTFIKTPRVRGPSQAERLDFALVEARPHKDGLIIKVAEVTDRTQAEALIGYEMQIPKNKLVAEVGDVPYLQELLGCTVFDAEAGELGPIESFATNTAQDLLVVRYRERELMIPFVKEFVESMDLKSRVLRMKLPPGLVDFAV